MHKLTARYPTDLPAWRKLREHWRERMAQADIATLFRRDPGRYARFSLRDGDLLLDFSRNRIAPRTLQLLLSLAREAGVADARDAMLRGEHINVTEGRAVLHAALRGGRRGGYEADGEGVSKVVSDVLDAMLDFVDAVHAGGVRSSTGKRFTDVINVGIGGSDLGIVMACKGLAHVATGLEVHGVSNVDGTQFADLARRLDPATTLVVVCSKTFTTLETMSNAQLARDWIASSLGDAAVGDHFAAASTNHEAMDAFGIHTHRRFGFWDWVGGRYSLWSAVGLSIALGIGNKNFRELLAGGRAMDRHFAETPLAGNLPVVLGLLAVWNNNFLGAESQAILPYDNRLERFPAYLQQLQMESNGKSVRRDGRPVCCKTGMVIWGEPGSNAQHSFYQLLHQGTRQVPCDFLLPVQSSGSGQAQQDLAIANCLAQADALAFGYSEDDAREELTARGLDAADIERLAPHKVHAGNVPSSVLLMKALTPRALGRLIALYEHKVFVEGVIWGINSFDQWGVELGKKMASALAPAVADPARAASGNPATHALLTQAARWRA
ncbi:MAG: glucose-6-phosphate isomerase [Pseudomonadota bacterium]